MDAKTLFLKREEIQSEMAAVRAYSLATAKRSHPWWLAWTLLPLAGWFITRRSRSNGAVVRPHPILNGFLIAGFQKLFLALARRWGVGRNTPFLGKLFKN